MERQKHGFIFEEFIFSELSLTKINEYTAPYDAYDSNNFKYQIKLIKYGNSIDLGDIFRNAEKQDDFFLVIGFWKDKKDNIVEIYRLYIDCKKWKNILSFDYYDELKDWIRNKVSNAYEYDKQWKKEMQYWKEKFGKRHISIRFKRDHKNQRRIQCAINNKEFYSYFLKEFEYEQILLR